MVDMTKPHTTWPQIAAVRVLARRGPRIIPNLPWVADGDALVGASPSGNILIRIWQHRGAVRAALISVEAMTAHPLIARQPGRVPLLGGDINAAADRLEAVLACEGQFGADESGWGWSGLTLPPVTAGVWSPAGAPDRELTAIHMDGRRGTWRIGHTHEGFRVYAAGWGHPASDNLGSWAGAKAYCEAQDVHGRPPGVAEALAQMEKARASWHG